MTTDPRQVRDSLAAPVVHAAAGRRTRPWSSPGTCVIEVPFRADLCQQNGFLHAGVVTSVADSACGYAALTLMPAGSDVLSVEFKVNLLAPGRGERVPGRRPGGAVRAHAHRLPGRGDRGHRRSAATSASP